jgi:hypothetical protein
VDELDLQERLMVDLKKGMKAGESLKVSVIRMLRSSIRNKEIERGKNQTLPDKEVMELISTGIKQRQDAIELYIKGGRRDLEEKEKNEIEILKSYLPAPLTEEDLRKLIGETLKDLGANSSSDFGMAMKAVMPKVVGRAEGAEVSKLVKELLG